MTARLLMLVSCMTVRWLRTASRPSQAWAGGAASRVGGGLCYALRPELLRLPRRPGNERSVLPAGESRLSVAGR